MKTEWQPIETAPKDGTEIIGIYILGGSQFIYNIFWLEYIKDFPHSVPSDEGWWTYKSLVSRIKLEGMYKPTHWIPLPKLPLK